MSIGSIVLFVSFAFLSAANLDMDADFADKNGGSCKKKVQNAKRNRRGWVSQPIGRGNLVPTIPEYSDDTPQIMTALQMIREDLCRFADVLLGYVPSCGASIGSTRTGHTFSSAVSVIGS